MKRYLQHPNANHLFFSKTMEQKEKRSKTISEELDEIIESKKNEVSAWKKIAESLTNNQEKNTTKKSGK